MSLLSRGGGIPGRAASGGSSGFTQHQRRRSQQYLNAASRWFFQELDKGVQSPVVVVVSGVVISLAAWRAFKYYIEPVRQQALYRVPQQRVPLEDGHNAFWGFAPAIPAGQHAETLSANVEEDLRRPHMLNSERSEVMTADIVTMELPEFDPVTKDDVFYRSVHYVTTTRTTGTETTTKELDSAWAGNEKTWLEREEERQADCFARMPGQGKDVIHGIAKCRTVSSDNNCVPAAGHLEEETSRKLMLMLGPVHILRDVAKTSFPLRFSLAKEPPVETLICGMRCGVLPRWLSSAFPNFRVDVVERDGSLVRVCRRFLGLQETSNLHVAVADPIDYVRRAAAGELEKRYDLVLLDTADGTGRLSTLYGRLEFVNSVRAIMSPSGCAAVVIPNQDSKFVYSMVQNWRMAFAGRTVLLVHCVTSPHTILMTFQDAAERGKVNFGTVQSVDEFKDVLHAPLSHYGHRRVPFDLTKEVSRDNFRVLSPGQQYPLETYLPTGHPALRKEGTQTGMRDTSSGVSKWNRWIRSVASGWLSPSQELSIRSQGPIKS